MITQQSQPEAQNSIRTSKESGRLHATQNSLSRKIAIKVSIEQFL